MDVLAHTLWANAGARGVNAFRKKKGRPRLMSPGWTGFWGVFPDLFAFTIPMLMTLYQVIAGQTTFGALRDYHGPAGGVDIAAYLYQYSHSLVIWAAVFLIVWAISRRPRYELLGWALHILIDIPSHAIGFYPTPFLFPISEYRFPYGVSWGNTYYMIINYTALILVWGGIAINKIKNRNKTA